MVAPPHLVSVHTLVSTHLFNALLALKIGEEEIYGLGVIQGANKRVWKGQRGITKVNYIMVGYLSSVVDSPTRHCHFYVCI